MLPGFLRKNTQALIWIVPTIALTAFIADKVVREMNPPPPAKPELVKIPIEVINANESAKIVYIELETQTAIPEPSTLLFLPLTALALLRRQR